MLRPIIKKAYARLARVAIKKYNTRVILIYGWDWSEVVRETLYNLLEGKTNVRRNTEWIKWDLGLPLFILGYKYYKSLKSFELIVFAIKSIFILVKPVRYQNLLIASVYAKSTETLKYWLDFTQNADIILLPFRETETEFKEIIMSYKQKQLFEINPKKLNKENYSATANFSLLHKQIFNITKYIVHETSIWELSDVTDGEIAAAVLKVDWERYFLERVRANLRKDELE